MRPIIQNKGYINVPVELLTTKFKGGILVDHVETHVRFSGPNGEKAKFLEKWTITPEKENAKAFYRKIQTSGTLQDIRCDTCEIQTRKFMEGVLLLTITPNTPLHKGKPFTYNLEYTILNGFCPGEEYWNFDIESFTEQLKYTVSFNQKCQPTSFKALLRDPSRNSSTVISTPASKTKQTTGYSVNISNLPIGAMLVVKWKWSQT